MCRAKRCRYSCQVENNETTSLFRANAKKKKKEIPYFNFNYDGTRKYSNTDDETTTQSLNRNTSLRELTGMEIFSLQITTYNKMCTFSSIFSLCYVTELCSAAQQGILACFLDILQHWNVHSWKVCSCKHVSNDVQCSYPDLHLGTPDNPPIR